MVTRDELRQADARAKRLRDAGPTAVSAAYDRRTGRIVVRLTSGIDIGFSPHDTQGLETARPAQLNPIEISPSGLGLHFPKVDADLYLPALLEGVFGSRRWIAARSGEPKRRSGVSSKPSASSRKSGGPGGRTRKAAAE
jgi:Protein of unknown function (DUF2442)